MSLSQIRFVLVNTSHPGNIGATARALKNMGLERLYLVDPLEYPHAEATARASGADDLLARAVVCATLEEAVADCALVLGASARLRTLPWPVVEPREAAARAMALAGEAQVAVVLGREHSGLTNQELERCNALVHIPSNPRYSSLNVAAAAQVLAYELHLAAREAPPAPETDGPLATGADMEGLYAHLEQVLVEVDYLDPGNPRQLMRRLRRLFNRAQLERMELNILRGVLTAVQKKTGR
ncbi:RNA methyltransferase [Ectothiorhodospiraceae bacterium 2226]|nr:RNA methyltransferase [Ectothiorhodospiraceae bacterium 2226]